MTGQTTTGQTQEITMRPDEVDDRLRAAEAANLRRDGLQWGEIAQQLAYHDAATAHRAVSRLVRRESAESATEYRALMLDRYEALWRAAWARVKATDADSAAVVAAVRVADRLVALTGADQPADPTTLALSPGGSAVDQEIAELIAQVEANARAAAARDADEAPIVEGEVEPDDHDD